MGVPRRDVARMRLPSLPGAIVAAAVLAQGVALGAGAVPLAAAAALACALGWDRRARLARADLLIATAAFGGLGMIVGGWLFRVPAAHAEGMTHAASAPAAWSAATGVMLLTCAAACRWTCAPLCRGGRARRAAAHLLASAAMVGGMAAAGALLSPPAAAMHLVMVAGMTAGMAAALPAVRFLDARSA